jgi:hypothetical protein
LVPTSKSIGVDLPVGRTELILVTTVHVNDRAADALHLRIAALALAGRPTTMVVEVTRAGVLGGPSSTTRSIYRKE